MKSYETEPQKDTPTSSAETPPLDEDGDVGAPLIVSSLSHENGNGHGAMTDDDFEAVEAGLIAHMWSDDSMDDEESMWEERQADVKGEAGQLLLLQAPDAASMENEASEDVKPVPEPHRRRFKTPTREQWLAWLPFGGVILLGALLRFWGLGDKPLHHDESLHAYYSWQLMLNVQNYQYNPLLHGPFQFHAIALTYKIAQWLGIYDNGINTYTVRIPAATLGTLIVALPYFLRDYLSKLGAWLACLLLAISPSMVYFSRFAREDIYMACFTLLMVVSVARYIRDRKIRWILLASTGFALSYATKEATFLTVIVFGSFMGALIVWELGRRWSLLPPVQSEQQMEQATPWGAKYLPKTAAPILLAAYFLVIGLFGKWFLDYLKALSIWITDKSHPANMTQADAYVGNLKDITVAIVPWLGIALGVYVLSILWREMYGRLPRKGKGSLAARLDPQKQPLLNTVLTMPWTHWFFALLVGWGIFLLLFTVLFTNIKAGIGDGIWQGLYYWLQQQQVARGGQPIYYYLMLIPFYEQIGVVFGVVGIVRCLIRPNPFRLFMVYWFLGNLVLYSWAAEKMPWLVIHMTMPLMVLAAIGLEPVVIRVADLVKAWIARWKAARAMTRETAISGNTNEPVFVPRPRPKVSILAGGTAIAGFVLAVLCLLPTLQNMYQVSYVHASDGPHEMLIYVQTTTDVNIVMSKITALDQKYYGGTHQLPIGLMSDADWPFLWYLRDYPNLCLEYSTTTTACPGVANAAQEPVIIAGPGDVYTAQDQFAKGVAQTGQYMYHQYHLRTWWDQGYMPPACVVVHPGDCADASPYVGVGPLLWMSYGDNPPQNAKFNLGMAVQNVWHWWWERRPFGATDGTSDMGLLIRANLNVAP